MLFLSRLLRILFLLFVVRLVLRAVAAFVRGGRASAPTRTPESRESSSGMELVRDRVCNTFVPRQRALVARIGGQEESFCSARCRDQALAAVSRAS